MMAIVIRLAAAILVTAVAVAPLRGQPAPQPLQPQRIVFDGETSVLDTTGRRVPAHVTVTRWIVANGGRSQPLPRRGFLIVSLFAGALTTIIDGQRQTRGAGETFTVPSRARLAIETDDDAVTFQTIEIVAASR